MATLHCLVTWPEGGSGSVRLRRSVPPGGVAGGGASALGAGWEERCGVALRTELDRYKAAEVLSSLSYGGTVCTMHKRHQAENVLNRGL